MPTAIVTGASRGLGLELTRTLTGAGWRVIVDARDAAELSEAVGGLPGVTAVAGDVTSPAHREELIDAAWNTGGLDLLVNNAGTLGPSPLPSVAELPLAALRDVFETNVLAPLALTQLAAPMLRAARGAVVLVTSDAAVAAYPGWGGYGAGKAALEQLGRVLGAEEPELAVWQLDPGDLRTRMHQDAFPGEDISDRPLPSTVAPGLLNLLAKRPASGRQRLADWLDA
ncbi:NAD(P)-dependent dehydrogenase (short-subunit alcohol dehydrogenase family) [Allocatelliglobosispora scoriae]|uniref:NAD(P)-dependent dehydrogenase (Short-subunit alcohol dehydrogenase family) n=1 Tax=Allocatelliglobosispora scoriae TaxID=643052 RepID=A0A841BXM9_9ACTN|nr:SDR family oxidoreductase [Allocatelliglobosispora scoriae]MBB5872914.1 NAD(P)-dependent dehydrogenase (short-subunit alcohol dehydrogenase family) [Allocatelliglobosispora scoriae]